MYCSKTMFIAFAFAATVCGQVEPGAGKWQTWVLSSGNQMRLPAFPDDNATTAELTWLKSFMSNTNDVARAQMEFWDAGSPAYRWIKIASDEMIRRNVPAPLYTRDMALVSAAIYDGTIAAWDSKYTWKRPRPSERDGTIVPRIAVPNSPSYPSEHAVAAGAAAAVLSYLFPDGADRFASLAQEAARSRLFSGTQYPSDTIAGLQLGNSVGGAVVTYARGDNSDAIFSGTFAPTPGKWSNPNPTTPLAGTWRPWVLSSGNQLRPDAPPASDSPEFAAQVALVKDLARTNITNHSAWFWQPSFVTPWLDTVHREIFDHRLDTNPPRAARAYALATIAQHDATIACWDTKFAYLEPRPSMADASITPLFPNPAHPGFPSGHACASGASASVLGYLFGAEAQALNDQATDAGMSTFYALIHTPFDVQQGFLLGTAVGNKVVAHAQGDGSQ